MKPKFEMIFRDRLALDRTYLAKERTVLSYIRTGLAFIGISLFVYKFMDVGPLVTDVLMAAFLVPGIIATLYGMYKILIRRSERKEFEKKYMMVKDDGE